MFYNRQTHLDTLRSVRAEIGRTPKGARVNIMPEAINISHLRCEAIRIGEAMKRSYEALFNCFMYSTSAFA
jgi:hypothetical protein